jgi:hypothetical protein
MTFRRLCLVKTRPLLLDLAEALLRRGRVDTEQVEPEGPGPGSPHQLSPSVGLGRCPPSGPGRFGDASLPTRRFLRDCPQSPAT